MKTQEISEKIEQRLIKEGVVDRDDIAARPFRRSLLHMINNEVLTTAMMQGRILQVEEKLRKKDKKRKKWGKMLLRGTIL